MLTTRHVVRNLLMTACACSLALPSLTFAGPVTPAPQSAAATVADAVSKQATPDGVVGQLTVTEGKSLIIDSPLAVTRLAVANGSLVDVEAISPKEILLNGKARGQTSLTVWRENGTRLVYDLTVRGSQRNINPEAKSAKPAEGK